MLSRAEERLLHALQRRKTREAEGLFVAEGVRVAEEIVRRGCDLRLAVLAPSLEDGERGRLLAAALRRRVAVREVSETELRRHAATDSPQGVIVIARAPSASLDALVPGAPSVVLVADAVQDPGNLGTLIRAADAFGAVAVVGLSGTVDFWNPKVVRAAAGSSVHLPLVAADLDQLEAWLERNRVRGLAADIDGERIDRFAPAGSVALMVGNEGAGLRPETRKLAHTTVSIPMPGHAESLNVAVAAGILLYELTRRMG